MINLSMAVYSPDNIFRSTTGGPASGIEWLREGVPEKCVDFYSIENSEEPVADFSDYTINYVLTMCLLCFFAANQPSGSYFV